MSGSSRSRESGQAAVETALVLPLLVFLCLGLLQLTLTQQAKLFTEFAAFSAARAGIVWNGNNERMKDAAVLALLPSMGLSSSPSSGQPGLDALAGAYRRFLDEDALFQRLPWGNAPREVNGVPLRGLVRVDTLNPGRWSRLGAPWNLADGAEWEELDFDGPDGFPESPELEGHVDKLFDVTLPNEGAEAYRRATVLSIRVRYWYELRIPFANAVLFGAWYAANAGVRLSGAIERPSVALATSSSAVPLENGKGHPTATQDELTVLWTLAMGDAHRTGVDVRPRYYLPLSATYSMRMQSNFHRKWLMHE